MIKNWSMALIPIFAMLTTLQGMSETKYKGRQVQQKSEARRQSKPMKAKSSQVQLKKKKTNYLGANLGTEHQFDNLSVHGRYQGPFQGVATVENEKEPVTLIDYRKDYKDRLKQSVGEL